MSEIKALRHTRKSVRTGYDVRGTEGRKKNERSKNVKQEEQRRTQKRAPESVPFAFIRGPSRPLGVIYPLLPASFSLPLFLLSHVNPSGFLFLAFPAPVFGTALFIAPHVRADYALSSRNYFAYMPLPFSLPSATLCHLFDPHTLPHTFSRRYHAALCKIYVCRRAGDVAAGYLFFQ